MIPTMQQVEERLNEIGVKHAPIQGFTEEPGVDKRYVKLTDPPGTYYLLGIDLQGIGHGDPVYNQIQIIFLDVMECADGIATAVGWSVLRKEDLSTDGTHAPIPSAVLQATAS
jgi:hypothetical protein